MNGDIVSDFYRDSYDKMPKGTYIFNDATLNGNLWLKSEYEGRNNVTLTFQNGSTWNNGIGQVGKSTTFTLNLESEEGKSKQSLDASKFSVFAPKTFTLNATNSSELYNSSNILNFKAGTSNESRKVTLDKSKLYAGANEEDSKNKNAVSVDYHGANTITLDVKNESIIYGNINNNWGILNATIDNSKIVGGTFEGTLKNFGSSGGTGSATLTNTDNIYTLTIGRMEEVGSTLSLKLKDAEMLMVMEIQTSE